MTKARRNPLPGSGLLRLMVTPRMRVVYATLNVVPLPGVGALLLGWRNAHTNLRRNGILQLTLVLFGSWPLVVPGVIGILWAAYDAMRIAQARLIRFPASSATDPAREPD